MADKGVTKDLRYYRRRLDAAKTEFEKWRPHFQEISENLLPTRGRFLYTDTIENDGKKRHSKIFDNTGTKALNILAAGMHGGMTSPARPWFKLALPGNELEDSPTNIWLEEVRRRMFSVLGGSNFYNSAHALYEELGAFGTGAFIMEEDFRDVIRVYPLTVGEYFLTADHTDRVDTMYRIFSMTAENIVSKFGEDAVPSSVKQAVASSSSATSKSAWHKVAHIIEPNVDRDASKKDSANMAWKSLYFMYKGGSEGEGDDEFLKISGYKSFPVMAPRWSVTGSEIYGRSPGMDNLADVKMLQKMQEESMKALAKKVNPPMNAPSNMKGKAASLIPGGINYNDEGANGQSFKPTHLVDLDIRALEFKIERVQESIRQGFFTDLFLAMSNKQGMTATEVMERHEEKLLMLGPVIERIMPELLDPVVERVFEIMSDAGLIPDAPPGIEGRSIDIEYVSPLAQAQKAVGVSTIEQLAAFVGNMSGINPETLDNFDQDEAVKDYARLIGVSPKIIRDKVEVEKIRAERQKQQAQQAAAEQGAEMAKGAQLLSETNITDESALTALGGVPGIA